MFNYLDDGLFETKLKNKKTVRRLLDKYGTLDNFKQNSTLSEDFEYQFAQGDDIVDEVERERQAMMRAMNSEPKQQGTSLDDIDMMKNASTRDIERDSLLENKYSTLLSNVRKHLLSTQGENFVPYIYLDSKGIITTGIGSNIDDFNVFMNTDFTVDNRPATYQEKLTAYNRFNQLKQQNHWGSKYSANMFKNKSNLRISTETANEFMRKHTLNDLKRLREGFDDFDTMPMPLQEVLMDIRYNTGNVSKSNWPNLHEGIRTKNLSLIADNVNRKDVSKDRNKWAREKILSIREPW